MPGCTFPCEPHEEKCASALFQLLSACNVTGKIFLARGKDVKMLQSYLCTPQSQLLLFRQQRFSCAGGGLLCFIRPNLLNPSLSPNAEGVFIF